ncbi:MAG: biotin--[acetyl-CoA-carboxylase] ligase [Propionibacteriaceae bacterium]|nr:biotin--[acetyl-CoA-carboxylase] ligase [Propionibacteriaceae bacterium]
MSQDWLSARLEGSLWTNVRCVAATGSTNADLLAEADRLPSGSVEVSDYQSRGRGRLDRAWVAPPGAMAAFSVYLRFAEGAPASWQFIPILGGLAVWEGLREAAGADTTLKWPNDVLVGGKKICGVLAQVAHGRCGPGVVLGIGVNTKMDAAQLPVPTATSLALEGLPDEPGPVVLAVLRSLERWYRRWEAGEDIATAYAAACDTIGRRVRVVLPGDGVCEGEAVRVDSDGSLVVLADGRERVFAAGDVVHLR